MNHCRQGVAATTVLHYILMKKGISGTATHGYETIIKGQFALTSNSNAYNNRILFIKLFPINLKKGGSMNKGEIIAAVASESGINKTEAEKALNSITGNITKSGSSGK